METIIDAIVEARKGMYVHALEVNDVYELQCCIEQIAQEFEESHGIEAVKDFFSTISIHCLDESNEEEVYNFNTDDYIDCIL